MRYKFTFLSLILLFCGAQLFAQRSDTHYVLNPSVVGPDYSFDIWSQRTNVTGSLLVNICSYYFDLDNTGGFNFGVVPTLTNANAKYTGLPDHSGDYDPMTAQFVNVGGTQKLAITIKYTGNNTGLAGGLSIATPNGELMCTVHVTVANASKTASLVWDQINSAMTTTNSQPVTDIFSGSNNSALPVELTNCTASASRLNTTINWTTATETNNFGFDVERKTVSGQQSAAGSWTKVGFVGGKGTSTSPTQYSYVDESVAPGTYDYRVKQIDKSGSFKYSTEMQVQVGLAPKVFTLSNNYPNPFNPTTNIDFTLQKDGKVSLKVYNSIGQEVATLFDGEGTAGQYIQARFDATRLASGIYFARLQSDGKSLMKKMLLLK
jgi:hypothetical protein